MSDFDLFFIANQAAVWIALLKGVCLLAGLALAVHLALRFAGRSR